jgi:serine-type D-Ala-D-Ala carboxypeptidase
MDRWRAMQKNTGDIDSYFRQFIDEGITSCLSILLFAGGEAKYSFLEGNAIQGDPSSAKLTERTRLNIGSVTKTVTGALVVKLQEQGLLHVNDKVKKYLPRYAFDDVTILHLLTHTAGYGDVPPLKWPESEEQFDEYIKNIYAIDCLKRAPGTESEYFTPGYTILMDILQRVTGSTIEEFARRELFKPLGMDLTTYDARNLAGNDVILPRTPDGLGFYPPKCTQITADSGLYSTAADLIRFTRVFLDKGRLGGIFSDESLGFMKTAVEGGKFNRTPIFWMKGDKDVFGCFGTLASASCIGHPGFSGCMLFIDPAYDAAGVILSNSAKLHCDWRNYMKIWDKLYKSFLMP